MNIEQIERRIGNILHKILEIPPDQITPEAHVMDDLGADSWQYLEFRTELEKNFQVTIPDGEVE